jgi:hypothetical protein
VKRCVCCGIERPIERFEPRRRTCRDCVNAANRGRKTYSTEGHRRWTYGMSDAEFQALLTRQAGRCPVCELLLVKPVVDHDHRVGAVRGLLCASCNLALGHFRDDPDRCLRAALYLQ